MYLRILKIGTTAKAYEPLAQKFYTFLQPNKLEIIELKASKKSDKEAAIQDEAERLMAKIQSDWPTIVLTEHGRERTSQAFADWLEETTAQTGRLQIIIAGAFGFPEQFRSQFEQISLSQLTLPHDLAFVVLLEQLYRALTIKNNKTYHY